jgi:N-acetylglucosamine kinase-like BadF-type ATPase
MSVEKEILKTTIKNALTMSGVNDATSAARLRDELATKIADAVEVYTNTKLNALKAALVAPGAYVGAGTGTIVVTPAGISSYRP